MKYVIITPAKDEEKYIEYTLNSVCSQTLKPQQWIIVNDGSTDNTAYIVEKYAKEYSWIQLINNNTINEERSIGSKIVRAFYVGYNSIENRNYDFIVKLDADLTLPRDYFEVVAKCFKKNTAIGICGGKCVIEKRGKLVLERSAGYHLRGPIKAYRLKCFSDIGGLKPVLGWDGIDEFTAMYYGWEVKVIDNLIVIHHRPTGYETGKLKHGYIAGKIPYVMGYGPFLTLLRSTKIGIFEKPYILKGIAMYFGFLVSFIRKDEQPINKSIMKFIRKFQYNRIKTKILKK